jgi:hypothetical protein
MALKWLALGSGAGAEDREPDFSRVLRYAAIMSRGKWRIIGDPICFDDKGLRLNGKHRLLAVIKNGKPMVLKVIRGFPPDCQRGMDQGKSRGASDWLHHSFPGIPHRSVVSPVLNLVLALATGYQNFSDESAHEAVAGMYEKDLIWLKKVLVEESKLGSKLFHNKGIRTALVIGHHFKRNDTTEMVRTIIDGENLKKGTPARYLRDYLQNLATDKKPGENDRSRAIFTLRAIMGHCENHTFERAPRPDFDAVLAFFVPEADRLNLIPEGVYDERFAKIWGGRKVAA